MQMNVYMYISYVISHIFLMIFFITFIPQRFLIKKSIIIYTASVIILGLIDYINFFVIPGNNILFVFTTIIQVIVVQGSAFFLSETRDSKAVFTGLSGSNYVIAGSTMGSLFYIYTENIVYSLFFCILTHILILILLIIRIRKVFISFYEMKNMKNWWKLCLSPVFFYCSFIFLASFPHSIYDNHNNILGIIMLIITMFVSYIVIFDYVENEMKRSDIYWKNILFKNYIKSLESQYEAVENTEQNLKILRHDMRHYMSMIYTLLEQKEYDKIQEIIKHISEVTDENKIHKYCENIRINSIISNLMQKAKIMNITVNMNLMIPDDIPVNDFELASVLANLFENALINVEGIEEKHVDFMVRYINSQLIIEIKNKCSNDIKFSSISGLPLSKKGEGHGIGLQSVYAFANKIEANFDCYCENGIFIVRLLANI